MRTAVSGIQYAMRTRSSMAYWKMELVTSFSKIVVAPLLLCCWQPRSLGSLGPENASQESRLFVPVLSVFPAASYAHDHPKLVVTEMVANARQ